jgi:hypothetical protein
LVEEHRLTEGEKLAQKVSSFTPWMLFAVFATTPFVVMKYHLDRLSNTGGIDPITPTEHKVNRFALKKIRYDDMPEIIERRTPTLVGIASSNYHSNVICKLFEEIDGLFEKYGINVNVVLLDAETGDEQFRAKYDPSLAPYCQLISPTRSGEKSVVDYDGIWNIDGIVRFVLSEKQVTPLMVHEMMDRSRSVDDFHRHMFRSKFVS